MASKKKEREKFAKASLTTALQYYDTHVHLDWVLSQAEKPVSELKSIMADSGPDSIFGPGFRGALNVCCEADQMAACDQILLENPTRIRAAYGIHPHNAKDYTDELEAAIKKRVSENPLVVAWGEIGLDYHYDNSPRPIQKEVFARQLKQALLIGKPIVIHSREAEDDTMETLRAAGVPSDYPMHLHCFTGQLPFALAMTKEFSGLKVGLTGCSTFKNASHLREVAATLPLERLLLETDGPFMAPEPHRGQIAHPGHIPLVASTFAKARGCTIEEVLSKCLANAESLYHFNFEL